MHETHDARPTPPRLSFDQQIDVVERVEQIARSYRSADYVRFRLAFPEATSGLVVVLPGHGSTISVSGRMIAYDRTRARATVLCERQLVERWCREMRVEIEHDRDRERMLGRTRKRKDHKT